MSKFPLFIIMLVAIALFATADFYLNNLEPNIKETVEEVKAFDIIEERPVAPPVNDFQDSSFGIGSILVGYQITNQAQASQLFEKVDLTTIPNLRVYVNDLLKTSEGQSNSIRLYEVLGPLNQGSLSYLNVKLQFLAQLNKESETLNENLEFVENGFFFNDSLDESTANLLIQVGDTLYGFQYSKEAPGIYEDVQSIVRELSNPAF